MTTRARVQQPRRIVLVTGIFPPDIGGPATHVADLREALLERGDEVTVLTLGDGARVETRDGIVRVPRSWPWPRRHGAMVSWLVGARARYEVVYATGMQPAAVTGAKLAGRPIVVKVVGDPAWERGRRRGLTDDSFDDSLERTGGPARMRAMRTLRNVWLRAADEIVTPSEFLATVVERWLRGPAHVRVVPNGVRAEAVDAPRPASRVELRCVWVGRLVAHKRVERLIEAVARTPGVTLQVVGDGPEAPRLAALAASLGVADRVVMRGGLDHGDVMAELAAADASLLASDYEGLPHVVIEALAVGTPIVSPAVGGTRELLRDGETGLEVPDASVQGFADAFARLRDDPALLARLAAGAADEGARWRFDATADGVRDALAHAASPKPRVVLVGKTHLPSPPSPDLVAKFRVLQEFTDPALVNIGAPGVGHVGTMPVVRLPALRPAAAGGALFYAAAPIVAAALAVGRRRSAIVCQSPLEGAGTIAVTRLLPAHRRPRVVVEVHGDWRTATRLYGSRARRVLSPAADRICEWTIAHADRVRVIGDHTAELVEATGFRGPMDRFVAFNDPTAFGSEPLPMPRAPTALFVGSLHPVKGPDVLLDAWARVLREVPDAELQIIGAGPMEASLRASVADLPVPTSVRFHGRVPRDEVATAIDGARLLVAPSRSEGLGLAILEAMSRGRAVVASDVGGIPELVLDDETGSLVPPERDDLLADAIVVLLRDDVRCERYGRAGRDRVADRDVGASFAAGTARLAAWLDER